MSKCINCPRESQPDNFLANGNIGPFCGICWNTVTAWNENPEPKGSRADAFQAINNERVYQDERWPRPAHSHEVESFLVYIRHYLREAETVTSTTDCTHTLNKRRVMDVVRKIAALAVAAMEQHGVVYRQPKGGQS